MKKMALAALMLSVGAAAPDPAFAINNDECSIWLCLPTGFPSGCGGAKSAFKRRIKKLKPPLPDFGSCVISPPSFPGQTSAATPSKLTSRHGRGALIPEHTVCTKRQWVGHGDNAHYECVKTEVIPTHVIHDRSCSYDHEDNYRSPAYCSRTIKYVQTFMDGAQYGETYYFDNRGNKIYVPQ